MKERTFFNIIILFTFSTLTGCFGSIDSAALLRPEGEKSSFKISLGENQNPIANILPIQWKLEFDERISTEVDIADIISFNTSGVEFVIEETEDRKTFLVTAYEAPFTTLSLNINATNLESAETGKVFSNTPQQSQNIELKQPFINKGSKYHSSIKPQQEISRLSYVGVQDGYTILRNKNIQYIRTKGTPKTTSYLKNIKTKVNQEYNGVYYFAENDINDGGITKIYKASDEYSEDRELVYNFNVVKAHRKGRHSLSYSSSFTNFFYSFKGITLFIALHTDGYLYLWTTDGTTAGTNRIFQLPELVTSNTYINYSFVFDDGVDLYFSVDTSEEGNNWYVTDGTAAGSAYLGDFVPGTGDHVMTNSINVVLGNTFLYSGSNGSVISCYTLKNRVIAVLSGTTCGHKTGTPIIYGDNKVFWTTSPYSFFSFDGTNLINENSTTEPIEHFFTLENGTFIGVGQGKIYSFDKASGNFTEVIDYDSVYPTEARFGDAFHFKNKIYIPADDGGGTGVELRSFYLDGSHSTVADLNTGAEDAFPSTFIGNVVGDYLYFYYIDASEKWNIAKVDENNNVTSIPIDGEISINTSNIPSPAFWGNGNEVFFTASNAKHSHELFRLLPTNSLELLMNTNLNNTNISSSYHTKSGTNFSMFVLSSANVGKDLWRFNSATNNLDNFTDPGSTTGDSVSSMIYLSKITQRWFYSVIQTDNSYKLYITDGNTKTEITGFDSSNPPSGFRFMGETKDYYYVESREGSPVKDKVYSIRKSDYLSTLISEAVSLGIGNSSWRSYDFDFNTNELLFSGPNRNPYLTDGTLVGTNSIGPSDGSLVIDSSIASAKILNGKYVIFDLFDDDFYLLDPADTENPTSIKSLVGGYTNPRIMPNSVRIAQDVVYFQILDGVSLKGEYYSFDGTNVEKVFDETTGLGNDYGPTYFTIFSQLDFSLYRSYMGSWIQGALGSYFSPDGTAANSTASTIPYNSIECYEDYELCTYFTSTNFIVADFKLVPTADWGTVPGGPKTFLGYDGLFAAVYNDSDQLVCLQNSSSSIINVAGETFSLVAKRGSGKFLLKRTEDSILNYYNLDCSDGSSLTKVMALDEPGVLPSLETYVNDYLVLEIGSKIYSVSL
ncbi:MAG: hypothetical protein CL674_03225 [Bdellovibrionaceae bacterium]|nr:hypothetical protein [Pseudobdellovibrionaceae bacterium]|tara:strand:+ start:15638 stop:18997 length:3360 start_codon:yes stop_codon:yes gene_type:complete